MGRVERLESILKGEEGEVTDLKWILEKEPPVEWLKEDMTTIGSDGKTVKYLPIERVDYLLRTIYDDNWAEIMEVIAGQFNVIVTVRQFVKNPETQRVQHNDGIGSYPFKGNPKTAAAIAFSLARKQACKGFGKIFGRDLYREDFTPTETAKEQPGGPVKEEIVMIIENGSPAFERIKKQIQVADTKRKLTAVGKAIQNNYTCGNITEEELELLTEVIKERIG